MAFVEALRYYVGRSSMEIQHALSEMHSLFFITFHPWSEYVKNKISNYEKKIVEIFKAQGLGQGWTSPAGGAPSRLLVASPKRQTAICLLPPYHGKQGYHSGHTLYNPGHIYVSISTPALSTLPHIISAGHNVYQ